MFISKQCFTLFCIFCAQTMSDVSRLSLFQESIRKTSDKHFSRETIRQPAMIRQLPHLFAALPVAALI